MVDYKQTNKVIEFFELLKSQTNELKDLVADKDKRLDAIVYKLPITNRNQEVHKIQAPEQLSAKKGRAYATETISRILFEPTQNCSTTVRCPGLIQSSQETMKKVEEINKIKGSLEESIKLMGGSRVERQKIIAQQIPYFSYQQATRQIPIIYEAIDKCMFNWIINAYRNKKTTVKNTIDLIMDQITRPPLNSEVENWHIQLKQEIQLLSGLNPSQNLIHKKPLKPYPIVNVYTTQLKELQEQNNNKKITPFIKKMASLPLFYAQETNPESPPIKPLSFMDTRFKRAKRANKTIEDNPILPRLSLYCYKSTT